MYVLCGAQMNNNVIWNKCVCKKGVANGHFHGRYQERTQTMLRRLSGGEERCLSFPYEPLAPIQPRCITKGFYLMAVHCYM